MSGTGGRIEWTDATVGRLRALWDEGHSAAEIGRCMGTSKNAVVGKARRLHFPARPSPIRVAGDSPAKRPTPRPPGPKLAAITLRAATPPVQTIRTQQPHISPTSERASQTTPLRATAASPKPAARFGPCCWPIGNPGTPTFRFCDRPAPLGKSYCAEHAALAYTKPRDRPATTEQPERRITRR